MLKVMFSGNLGADPEQRFTAAGLALVSFRVAVNSSRKNGEEWEDHTDWFRVRLSGRRAEYLQENLRKGMRVFVLGKLEIGEYAGRDGEKRTSLDVWADEVDFAREPQGGDQGERPARPADSAPARQPVAAGGAAQHEEAVDLEDLPF